MESSNKIPAVVWTSDGEYTLSSVEPPRTQPGWVLVDVAYAGLCGTDLHIFRGEHPRAALGLVPGHEFVGTLHDSLPQLPAGTPVFVNPLMPCGRCSNCRAGVPHLCDNLRLIGIDIPGALCPQVLVPESSVLPLPLEIDLAQGALIEPLAVAVRAISRADVRLGSRVRVIGGGPMGCLIAVLAMAAGSSEVVVSEVSLARRSSAEALGLHTTDETVGDRSGDAVIDASGHPSVSPSLATWVRTGGTILIIGMHGEKPEPVELRRIMMRELRLIGSCTYSWNDIEVASRLVSSGAFTRSFHAVVTSMVGLGEVNGAMKELELKRQLKVLVDVRRPLA